MLFSRKAAALADMAASAPPTLCGFSAGVDAYVPLADAVPLWQEDAPSAARRIGDEVLRRGRHGIGGEIAVDWPEGDAWLGAHLPHRHGLGGTAAQIAAALATLGAPAVLALEDRSQRQLEVIPNGVAFVTSDGRLRHTQMVEPTPRGRARNWIFEYTKDRPIRGIAPPRSSRVIVRLADRPLHDDPAFDGSSAMLGAGAAVLAGFPSVPPAQLPAAIERAAKLGRRWRAAGTATVHVELADYGDRQVAVEAVMTGLTGVATSLGASLSEFDRYIRRPGSLAERAVAVARHMDLDRVAIHADEWAFAVTRHDAAAEREALICGCLLASARAAAGHIVQPVGPPEGAIFHALPDFGPPPSGWHVVACAAPYLPRPVSTIGLGDTFVAGCLLALGASINQPSFQKSSFQELFDDSGSRTTPRSECLAG
ncbi:ADP-dependent phosphofructokinase/glucokinase [Hyphomicrobiales bacterium]|nr:ADP-dependent phosphofructokinase/glucokinase [Hyphomicrobiales bacterium]CAH1694901.1 ADP-dependent phosphofructokinase/glucokinase [Hyphomicrobiales bacterium]